MAAAQARTTRIALGLDVNVPMTSRPIDPAKLSTKADEALKCDRVFTECKDFVCKQGADCPRFLEIEGSGNL